MTESLIDKFRTFPDNDGCDTITCKEKYKQQILENAEIVERLRNRITNLSRFPWMGDITTGIKNSDLTKILNEILGESEK